MLPEIVFLDRSTLTVPLRHGNPLLEVELTNLLVTPHTAWSSVETAGKLAEQLRSEIPGLFCAEHRAI